MGAAPDRVSARQAERFLIERYGDIDDLRSLHGGFWSSAYAFSHAGRELVVRFGARKDWFEADRAAVAFASANLPVPEVVEIGDAFDGAYAISARCHGGNLEDVRPDQSDVAGPLLGSLLAALHHAPKHPDLPVGWHWLPPRPGLTWRGWLAERLLDDPRQPDHGWSQALAAQPALERLHRAAAARVTGLLDACPERRDLVHGDLLHANVLVADDASRVHGVFSWKSSLRGDFLYDTAWCTFCGAIWHPGIAAADPWRHVQNEPAIRADADAWTDAAARHHCYELHIGLTAMAWNLWVDDAPTLEQVAGHLAEILDRGPLRDAG